jgi:hypothetical protein
MNIEWRFESAGMSLILKYYPEYSKAKTEEDHDTLRTAGYVAEIPTWYLQQARLLSPLWCYVRAERQPK